MCSLQVQDSYHVYAAFPLAYRHMPVSHRRGAKWQTAHDAAQAIARNTVQTVRLTQYNLNSGTQPLPIIGMILAEVLFTKGKKTKNRTTLFTNFRITLTRFFFGFSKRWGFDQATWPFCLLHNYLAFLPASKYLDFLPASPSATLPFARFVGFVGIRTVSPSVSPAPAVPLKQRRIFFQFSFSFLEDFSL